MGFIGGPDAMENSFLRENVPPTGSSVLAGNLAGSPGVGAQLTKGLRPSGGGGENSSIEEYARNGYSGNHGKKTRKVIQWYRKQQNSPPSKIIHREMWWISIFNIAHPEQGHGLEPIPAHLGWRGGLHPKLVASQSQGTQIPIDRLYPRRNAVYLI